MQATGGLPQSPGVGLRTLGDKQLLSGSEPTGTSLEQTSLCISGCTLSVGTVGRRPGSLKWHRVCSLRHRELETQ